MLIDGCFTLFVACCLLDVVVRCFALIRCMRVGILISNLSISTHLYQAQLVRLIKIQVVPSKDVTQIWITSLFVWSNNQLSTQWNLHPWCKSMGLLRISQRRQNQDGLREINEVLRAMLDGKLLRQGEQKTSRTNHMWAMLSRSLRNSHSFEGSKVSSGCFTDWKLPVRQERLTEG